MNTREGAKNITARAVGWDVDDARQCRPYVRDMSASTASGATIAPRAFTCSK